MWKIIMDDLVPIIVIMALGYVSGKRNAFSVENSRSFNKLVLNYALPAALFLSIVKADRKMLFEDVPLSLVSLIVIVAVFMWSYFSCHRFFKHTKGEAAVCALIAGSPTIGFLGFAVLDPIFGNNTTTGLVMAIVRIVSNSIAIPIGVILLNPKEDPDTSQTPKLDKDGKPIKVHKSSSNAFLNAIKEPVVWVPILAVVLVLIGIKFPPILDPSFTLIAKANSCVAVFAAGLTLSSQPPEFDKEIIYNTFVKLILIVAALLFIGNLAVI